MHIFEILFVISTFFFPVKYLFLIELLSSISRMSSGELHCGKFASFYVYTSRGGFRLFSFLSLSAMILNQNQNFLFHEPSLKNFLDKSQQKWKISFQSLWKGWKIIFPFCWQAFIEEKPEGLHPPYVTYDLPWKIFLSIMLRNKLNMYWCLHLDVTFLTFLRYFFLLINKMNLTMQ